MTIRPQNSIVFSPRRKRANPSTISYGLPTSPNDKRLISKNITNSIGRQMTRPSSRTSLMMDKYSSYYEKVSVPSVAKLCPRL